MHNLTPLSGLFGGALIGLAAASLMLLTGRIAGVSGIFGGLLALRPTDQGWRIAFVAGLIAAPLLANLAGNPLPAPAMTANSGAGRDRRPAGRILAAAWAMAAPRATASAVSRGCRYAPSRRR